MDRITSSGRTHRRVSVTNGRAHIEVRGIHRPENGAMVGALRRALEAVDGIEWADVNPIIGRVVVMFDAEAVDVDDVVALVEAVEDAHDVRDERFPRDRPEHPGDLDVFRRNVAAFAADALGLGASLFGQALRATPLPVEVASAVSLADNVPRVRQMVEGAVGAPAADLGFAMANAVAQGLAQGPIGLVVDMVHRGTLIEEARANRRVWQEREPVLVGVRREAPLEAVEHATAARPVPLAPGPVERFADIGGLTGLAGFAVALAASRDPRRSANVIFASLPKAARLGREAFAAQLGRTLAGRSTVVFDRGALRRLDRVSTVVIDSAVAFTGHMQIDDLVVLGQSDRPIEREASMAAHDLFDPANADAICAREGWCLGPIEPGDGLPRGGKSRVRLLERGGRTVLGLSRDGTVTALVVLAQEVDGVLPVIIDRAQRSGCSVVIAGGRADAAERLGAEGHVAGGQRLSASVRDLQRDGAGVLLISARPGAALRQADVGVGISSPAEEHHAWGADVLCAGGLEDAAIVVTAVGAARNASRQAALLSACGSVSGAVVSLLGPSSTAGRRALLPVNGAALLALAAGTWTAASLARVEVPRSTSAPAWHAMRPEAVLALLGSSRTGLRQHEAERRMAATPDTADPSPTLLRIIVDELANPLTPLLGLGAGLSAAVGSISDAFLISSVVITNSVISGVQRLMTERSLSALIDLSAVQVSVWRDGNRVVKASDRVVVGDVIELESGGVVPADCRVIEAASLEVDESSVTGESMPVRKNTDPAPGAAVADRHSMVYAGTTIAAGRGAAVVVAIGADTEAGRAAASVGDPPMSGVEQRLATLTRATAPVTILSGAIVTGLAALRRAPLVEAVGSGVSLMVAAVPEGLPLLATVAQLAAARRLSHRNALVRNPRTIEALGRVNTLCLDKTGTLTQGRIVLQRVSDGEVEESVDRLRNRRRAVLAAALRASPQAAGEGVLPHATDRAVVNGGVSGGVTVDDGVGSWQELGVLAFEPTRSFHAVVGRGADGSRIAVKGAPEVVLPRCVSWGKGERSVLVDDAVRCRLEAAGERMAEEGLRVLAVAERSSSSKREVDDGRVADLEFLGFLGLADIVRPTAASAVDTARRAGVAVVMITGDHPSTAVAIADELNMMHGGVLTGADLDRMSDDELDAVLPSVSVFARVTPEYKVRIVRAYQRAGRTVAMTGDGANDAAAIRLADAGIALGQRAAPAARAVADLVVTDDRIETIIDAIIEGRAMWSSVRDALAILLGGNLGEVAFTVGATAVTGRSPLTARQLLLVNLLTDMLPAMAIALRPPAFVSAEQLLHEGPEESLGSALVRDAAVRALVTASGAGAAWGIATVTGSPTRARTVGLVALVGTQLGQTALAGTHSRFVVGSAVVSAAVLGAIVQTPGLSQFFGCTPLGPAAWATAMGAAVVATGVGAVVPRFVPALGPSARAVDITGISGQSDALSVPFRIGGSTLQVDGT